VHNTTHPLDALLALREFLNEPVLRELASLRDAIDRVGRTANEYTSDALPPDIRTSARFNRIAKTVKGARRDGRVWRVPREAWEAHRLRRVATPIEQVTTAITVDTEADELLSGSGLRSTRLRIVGGGGAK